MRKVLPDNWVDVTLIEVARINPTIDKSTYVDDLDVSFVPMPAVEAETGKIDVSQIKRFGEVKKGYTPFLQHDVLFAKITPCMENGKVAVAPELRNDVGFGSTEFHVLRAYEGIVPHYLYYFVSSKAYRYDAEHNMTGAVGQKRVPTPYIERSSIPVPPTNEQRRIVAKIEELFSELDKGIENLKIAKEQLKVYRQAVLKHAFEGKLTADWREKNKDKLEPADKLFARIKREREAHYQQQLAARQKNALASKPRQIKDFSDLSAEELVMLAVLPQGWVWAKIISLFDIISGGTPKGIEETKGTDIPFYKVSDMNNAGNETYMHTAAIYLSESERAKLGLTCYPTGTIIFPKRGGAILTNKKRMLSKSSCFDLNIMGIISTAPSILKDYLWYWFQKLDLAKIYDGSNVPQINNKNVDPLPFPVCSVDEQEEIIKLLSAHISAIESTGKEIETNLQKSEALRQAILKKAFSGELVAQDPKDEPASVLLDRIRAEKESQSPQRKTKSKRGTA